MIKKLALCALLSIPTYGWADNVAVLLGNTNYQNFSEADLAEGVIGAAGALAELGFKVDARANASRRETIQALTGLANVVGDAERAIVVLNGKFLSYGGETWFLPVDATRPNAVSVGASGVILGNIMEILAELPGGAVLVLGQAGVETEYRGRLEHGFTDIDIPQGLLVIRGTSRQVTQFARRSLTDRRTDIVADARAQRLSLEGYVPKELVLLPRNNRNVPRETPEQSLTPNLDLQAWDAASSEDTVEAYRKYMNDFPRGSYRAEARARMTVLQNDPIYQARQHENDLNLTRDQKRQIQTALNELSYDTRGIDGLFGNASRRAISDWQGDQGYAGTAYLTENQIRLLMRQASANRAQLEEADRTYWSQTGATGGRNALLQYLDRYPQGIFAEQAKQKLRELNQGNNNLNRARAAEEALNLSPVIVGLIEFQLNNLGLNPGRMDGRLDEDARDAIREYQRAQQLPATGYIDREVIARLINR